MKKTKLKSETAKVTHNDQPKGDAPDLSRVSLIEIEDELMRRGLGFMFVNGKGIVREARMTTEALISEIFCRERAGECLALIVTPSDLSEYWEIDESGSTHPGSRVPEANEWHAIRRGFERWQDCGNFSDLMHTLRDAWQAEQARQLDQEGDSK